MRQKSVPEKEPVTQVVKNIRRATRRHFSAEDKIRIVLEGLRGEDSIAELCRRETPVAQLCVDAAVHGDRQAALQCLLLDPVITDLDIARQILDDYLQAYREHLPQFFGIK